MLSEFVEQELQLVASDRRVQFRERYAFICCPYHKDGQEAHPSMMVNLTDSRYDAGFFYCFSCGEKGPWNLLAEALNVAQLDSQTLAGIQEKHLIKPLELLQDTIEDFPGIPWNSNSSWRGIRGDVLSALESKQVFNFKFKEAELLLKVRVLKKEVGSIFCSLQKKPKGYPSYRNTSGAWVKEALFPFDYAKRLVDKNTPLFIVEGPRDALNLLQHGIPAVAILGCTNWCTKLLPLLYICKPSRYVIQMDGDLAGKRATEHIYKDLNKFIPGKVSVDILPDGKDPADLKEEDIINLRSRYFNF